MDDAIVLNTPEKIYRFRLLVLELGLKLEIKGMKKRGRSCYSIIKEEFGLKGSRESVLTQFEAIINSLGGNNDPGS